MTPAAWRRHTAPPWETLDRRCSYGLRHDDGWIVIRPMSARREEVMA